jgi:predicted nucleic acid-binding protein
VTTVKVVDASAVAAMLFEEPECDAIVSRLRGFALHAPYLIQHELTNVCVKKSRQDPQTAERRLLSLGMFPGLGLDLHEIDPRMVAALALTHKLSAYDASYLWLAREFGTELVTLDKRLAQAATQQSG